MRKIALALMLMALPAAAQDKPDNIQGISLDWSAVQAAQSPPKLSPISRVARE